VFGAGITVNLSNDQLNVGNNKTLVLTFTESVKKTSAEVI